MSFIQRSGRAMRAAFLLICCLSCATSIKVSLIAPGAYPPRTAPENVVFLRSELALPPYEIIAFLRASSGEFTSPEGFERKLREKCSALGGDALLNLLVERKGHTLQAIVFDVGTNPGAGKYADAKATVTVIRWK